MRAAVFHKVGQPLAIESIPDPVPDGGEMILEVARAGVCGSDLHWTETEGVVAPGTVLGHEFAGTVVEPNGSGVAPGTRVTALPLKPCWTCEECHGGHIYHCSSALNIGLQRNGAFARAVAVDKRLVLEIPAGVSFEEAAMIEPLAVGYRTVSHARALKGANVLVLGAGPIGSAVILFTALGGASKVIASEPSPGRRQMAIDLGANACINPKEEDVAARFRQLCGGPPDIVIECVGYPGMLPEAIRLVKHRGQIISAGGSYQADSFVPIDALVKEVSIDFSLAYEVSDFEAVIDALASHNVYPKPMVTDRITLDELPERFEKLRQPSTQCKVIIEINA
jgi:(R,R)-butanediol dehydrogenase / meso-butanediol dehydrogenase / diacetyl reductase